jgi:hypothetical protein
MDEKATRELFQQDKTIVELRALLMSYEQRLASGVSAAPDSHLAAAAAPEPLFLIDEIFVDLRSGALEGTAELKAASILDCSRPDEPDPFTFVHRVESGVFRVHPREGLISAALVGPFSGPPPVGLLATARTAHPAAPAVRFHISVWTGELDIAAVRRRAGALAQGPRFLTVPPGHPGFIIAPPRPSLRSPPTSPSAEPAGAPWAILLATVADPPEAIGYAWAEFSDVVLFFDADGRYEVRLLS